MFKRIERWWRLYWPSVLLIAELVLAYWFVLALAFKVVWPSWYGNGEPLSVTLDSTALMRSQEKLAFINTCYATYVRMGLFALGLYGVYALSGLLSMPYQAHVEFGKDCRSAFVNAFFATMLTVWSNLFAIRGYTSLSGILLNIMTIMSCALCLYYALFKMGCVYNRSSRKTKLRGLLISFGVLVVPITFFWFLQGLDNVVSFVLKAINGLVAQKDAVATAVPNHYMLATPVDFLLPAVLLLLLGFLYVAMKYAGPIAACTPRGGRAYSQISKNKDRFPGEAVQ